MGNIRSDPAVGARVAAAIDGFVLRGGKLVELADALGVTRGAVTKWKDGRAPGALTLPKLAAKLGVSVDFFSTGKDRTRTVYEVDKNARAVPLAGVAAAGAPMAKILEEQIPYFHMPEGFLREIYGTKPDGERAIILRVVGDSMEDDLPDGSLVFIDRGPGGKGFDKSAIRDGEIYMVIPPGEDGVTLKRVSIHGDFMTLEAANRDRRRFPLLHYPIRGQRHGKAKVGDHPSVSTLKACDE